MTNRKTATIDAESSDVTIINIFEVEPERQAELARMIVEVTEKIVRHRPGFVSANIHRSLDGTRVANYAQWASKEDFERVLKDQEAQAQFKQIAAVAKSVSPALYEVSSVHTN